MKTYKEKIAIVGIASIFPESSNKDEYWDKILKEVDCIKDVPSDRWEIEDYFSKDKKAPDKSYSKRGSFIPKIDFDPVEFGLPPDILEQTDASQLLSLVVARDVLKDSGYYETDTMPRDKMGIVLGVAGGQKLHNSLTNRLQYPIWKKVLTSSGLDETNADKIVEKIKKAYVPWRENSFPGLLSNVVSGRIANRFNFGGLNCTTDAACASSFAALKMAISELTEHRSDLMITGGVDTDNSPFMYLCFSKTPALTDKDKCSPFDENSTGIILGEGVGMVALKRFSDAKRDKDKIYALITGVGVSSDGRAKSIYAPSSKGQVKALKRAYEDAKVLPSQIGLIEMHGTGTIAGDLAEFDALKETYEEDKNIQKQSVAIGTVKSQIGHTKTSAGVAGLIKTAFSLHNKVLPPTINITKPHPKLDIENSPFYLNTKTKSWFSNKKRMAAVSSFGFGGTNFHFVLEEFTQEKAPINFSSHREIIICAENYDELKEKCLSILKEFNNKKYINLINESISFAPTSKKEIRVGFLTNSISDAKESIKEIYENIKLKKEEPLKKELNDKIFFTENEGKVDTKKIALIFSGQGAQYVNMGNTLSINFPAFFDSFVNADKLFKKPITNYIFPNPRFDGEVDSIINSTDIAQISIGAFSLGVYKILKESNLDANYFAGHSFGEITALFASGIIKEDDFLFLARERGKAMATKTDKNSDLGLMLAILKDEEFVKKEIKEFKGVTIANFNSDRQTVVAGKSDIIKKLEQTLKTKKIPSTILPVSCAFHTELMEHSKKLFEKAIGKVKFQTSNKKIYSNTSGEKYPKDVSDIKNVIKKHIVNPVLFKQEIENMYKDGARFFIEIGPKNILTKLIKKILKDKKITAIETDKGDSNNNDLTFRKAILKMRLAGLNLKSIYKKIPEDKNNKSRASIKINGCNYVSHNTQKAFEDSLNDDLNITHRKETIMKQSDTEQHFFNLQNKFFNTHNEFLKTHMEYSKIFYEITQKQQELLGKNPDLKFPDDINKSILLFHQQQQETLKVHQDYINTQNNLLKNYVSSPYEYEKNRTPIKNEQVEETKENRQNFQNDYLEIKTPQIDFFDEKVDDKSQETQKNFFDEESTTPLQQEELSSNNAENQINFKDELITIISKKTGYPEDVIGLDMDMESELGIDSIKRVEILGDITEKVPELETIEAEKLNSLKTINQILSLINELKGVNSSDINITKPIDTNYNINDEILKIVSKKTGYPIDVIGLDMDMESELGIDSIKRVEILGDITEKIPELETIEAEKLNSLKTINQIFNLIKELKGVNTSNFQTTKSTDASYNIKDEMLEIVSKKTGYPIDVIGLDMDMESELGIDSIKRVEILGDITEKVPELEKVDVEILNNIKTINDIISLIKSNETDEKEFKETESLKIELPSLKKIETVNAKNTKVYSNKKILITNDGTYRTEKVVSILKKNNIIPVVINLPQNLILSEKTIKNIDTINLKKIDNDELTKLSKIKNIEGFLHLNPNSKNKKDVLKAIFLIAKNISKNLRKAKKPFFISAVSIDGKFGLSFKKNFEPLDGGFFGLIKTLRLEWENVFCRALDISDKFSDEEFAKTIFNEIFDTSSYAEVSYDKKGRYTIEQNASFIPKEKSVGNIAKEDVFVVSGGAKGITAACVEELAKKHKCSFVLLGRTKKNGGEKSWSKGIEDDVLLKKIIMEQLRLKKDTPTIENIDTVFNDIKSNREIQKTIRNIEDAGSKVQYLSVDIRDKKKLKQKLSAFNGSVSGIIHGAGVLRDKLIEDKSETDFDIVYETKIDGLESLLACVNKKKLKHIIIFSSIAGFLGNKGQSDYSIANEILNKKSFLLKKQYEHCNIKSLNWGPWDGGMVDDSLKKTFLQKGVSLILPKAGVSFFTNFIEQIVDIPQILIGAKSINL